MNSHQLPSNLPAPEDDGAARHLIGARVPDISLAATDGRVHSLPELTALPTVLFFYPRTGVPGEASNFGLAGEDWDAIPGARGCTPQSCGFRDNFKAFEELGVRVFGVSTQTTEFQRAFRERNHIPFHYLSDAKLELVRAMRLPTFEFPVESGGPNTLIRRMSWFVYQERVEQVWYPVFPPDQNAAKVLAWLGEQLEAFRGVELGGVVYRRESTVSVNELAEVFARSGIQRPHDDPQRLGRMLQHANLTVTARVDGKLVGVARCLTDHAWCCYVSDLAVLKTQQGRGIGQRLLEQVRKIAGKGCTLILNAAPGAASYYPHVGFEQVASAWKIGRTE